MTITPCYLVTWGSGACDRVRLRPDRPPLRAVELSLADFSAGRFCRTARLTVPVGAGPGLADLALRIAALHGGPGVDVVSREHHVAPVTPVDRLTLAAALGDAAALAAHPAARVAAFAPAGSAHALAVVVGRIYDPRWYRHPRRPDRISRLEAIFGLQPRFDRVRCRMRGTLTAAWSGSTCAPIVGDYPAADYYRRKASALLTVGRSPAQVVRACSRHFLQALVASWLDAYAAQRGYAGDPMFDPAAAFDAPAYAATRSP